MWVCMWALFNLTSEEGLGEAYALGEPTVKKASTLEVSTLKMCLPREVDVLKRSVFLRECSPKRDVHLREFYLYIQGVPHELRSTN